MNPSFVRPRFDLAWKDLAGRKRVLKLGRETRLMGVLNVTPDSFYDGGRYLDIAQAVDRAKELEAEGADIIDVGGESSRPGAEPVAAKEELRRVIPVIEKLAGKIRVPISIDTSKAVVARAALAAGAEMINDISSLRFDPGMVEVAAAAPGPVILMHLRGRLGRMPSRPRYRDVVGEIMDFFALRLAALGRMGIAGERMILDPGLGFGKSVKHNLLIIAGLKRMAALGRPLLLGPSRKLFIGRILGAPPEERLWGTAGAAAVAVANGAHILRVHDPQPIREAARVVDKMMEAAQTGG